MLTLTVQNRNHVSCLHAHPNICIGDANSVVVKIFFFFSGLRCKPTFRSSSDNASNM